jgi:hypothetical protein
LKINVDIVDDYFFYITGSGSGNVKFNSLYTKQIYNMSTTYVTIRCNTATLTGDLIVSDMLMDGNGNGYVIGIWNQGGTVTCKFYNIKAWDGNRVCFISGCHSSSYIENVTSYESRNLVDLNSNALTVQNCFAVSDGVNDTFVDIGGATGNNNASDGTSCADANRATGSNNVTGITASNEFISTTDTSISFLRLKSGGSLYNGGTTPSITDNDHGIRGNDRSGASISIGADEYTEDESLFYSVGTSISDLKTGSPTVTISKGVATFSTAQTADIGVGDVITYDTNRTAYITGKNSQTSWDVSTEWGAYPTGSGTVNSIKRTFNSMNDAMDGSNSGSYVLLGSAHLSTHKIKLKIACYADGTDDSLTEMSTDWLTDSDYHITIYTPIDTVNECNNNQRHDGTVDGSGYTMESNDSTTYRWNLIVTPNYTKVFGLKIVRNSNNWSYGFAIGRDFASLGTASVSQNCEVAYNLLISEGGGSSGNLIAWEGVNGSRGLACNIHDNFLVSESTSLRDGLRVECDYMDSAARQLKFYNNTVYGKFDSFAVYIDVGSSSDPLYMPLLKNNYAANTGVGVDYSFTGTYNNGLAVFDYNASDDTTAGSSNYNQQITLANADFEDVGYTTIDLHLKSTSDLIGGGIGPSSDSNVPTEDIDGDERSGSTTSIGADNPAVVREGSGGLSSNNLSVSGSGNANTDISGSGDLSFNELTINSEGYVNTDISGSGDLSFNELAIDSEGNSYTDISGSGNISFNDLTINSSAEVFANVSGSGNISFNSLTISSSGYSNTDITGSSNLISGNLLSSSSGDSITDVDGSGQLGVNDPSDLIGIGIGAASTDIDTISHITLDNAEISGSGNSFTNVTGSGNLTANKLEIDGSGESFTDIDGSGDIDFKTASLYGFAIILDVGFGSLQSSQSLLSGSGNANTNVSGSGNIEFNNSSTSGNGISSLGVSGSGNIQFDNLNIDSDGNSQSNITGSGDLQSNKISSDNSNGTASTNITGSGDISFNDLEIQSSANVSTDISGSGDLVSGELSVDSSGTSLHGDAGSGNLVFNDISVSGSGTSTSNISGSGSLIFNDLSINATGARVSNREGSGQLIANKLDLSGTAFAVSGVGGFGNLIADNLEIISRGQAISYNAQYVPSIIISSFRFEETINLVARFNI